MASTVAHYRHGFSRIEVCAATVHRGIRNAESDPAQLSRNPERSWIEKLALTTLCWDIYPHEPRTPSRRTPNDLSERGPGSLPVWLLPQCVMNSAFFTPLGGQKTSSNRTPEMSVPVRVPKFAAAGIILGSRCRSPRGSCSGRIAQRAVSGLFIAFEFPPNIQELSP
jgi:hypothetical protein